MHENLLNSTGVMGKRSNNVYFRDMIVIFANFYSSFKKSPSLKMVQFVILFRTSLAITLLLGVLFLSGCSRVASTAYWQSVGSLDLVPLAKQAIAENSIRDPESSESVTNVLVMRLPTHKQQNQELFLLDYNTEGLCGRRGCLYSIYSQQGQVYKLLWSEYLQPNLPPNENLFTPVTEESNIFGFPCLDIKQMQGNRLQKLVYCFDGKTYRIISKDLFAKNY